MRPRDRLARLHFVNTLCHALTGHDLYLAAQVLDAVEEATSTVPAIHEDPNAFSAVVEYLHEALTGGASTARFAYIDCARAGEAGPLWVQAGLQQALTRHASADQATVLVANVAGREEPATTEPGPASPQDKSRRRRSLRRRAREYAENIGTLRALAARKANPQSLVTLLFV